MNRCLRKIKIQGSPALLPRYSLESKEWDKFISCCSVYYQHMSEHCSDEHRGKTTIDVILPKL